MVDVREHVATFLFGCCLVDVQHQVKCVAGVGPFLASGGADDTIHLYDIQVRHLTSSFIHDSLGMHHLAQQLVISASQLQPCPA